MSDKQIIVIVSGCGFFAIVIALFIMLRPSTPHASSPMASIAAYQAIPVVTVRNTTSAVGPVKVDEVATVARNQVQAPTPFRGVSWGELLSSRSDMSLAELQLPTVNVQLDSGGNVEIPEIHLKRYVRANEKNSFGSQTVGEIEYIAFDGKFYDVSITDLEPFGLATVFSQIYGQADASRSGDSRYWNWKFDNDQTEASMGYSPPSDLMPNGVTWAHITNKLLDDELSRVRKAEASQMLSKVKKDF